MAISKITSDAIDATDFNLDSDTLKIDSTNNRVGILEASPTVPLEVKGAQGYASSASNLLTSTTKATAKIRGSSDATASLFFGSLTNDAEQYIQSCNGAGDGADDIVLNPFGGNVGIGTPPLKELHLHTQVGSTGDVEMLMDTGSGSSAGQDSIINSYRSNADLIFKTNNAERMRILSGGGLTFGGETAQAHALDDYQEGTWTAGLKATTTNPTYTAVNNNGVFTKIGDLVYIQWYSSTLNISNAGSGIAYIDGLPFAPLSSPGANQYAVISFTHTTAFADQIDNGYTVSSGSFIYPIREGLAAGVSYNSGSPYYIMMSGVYKTS